MPETTRILHAHTIAPSIKQGLRKTLRLSYHIMQRTFTVTYHISKSETMVRHDTHNAKILRKLSIDAMLILVSFDISQLVTVSLKLFAVTGCAILVHWMGYQIFNIHAL